MASDLPKHTLGASANTRAQLSRIDEQTWGTILSPPFINIAPNSKKADKTGLETGAIISANSELADTLKPLQLALHQDSGLEIGMTYFQNWADTRESLLLYGKPQTVQEVQKLVQAAYKNSIKMGVGGAYHSWSPMFPDEGGLLINACELKLDMPEINDNIITDGNCRIYHDCSAMTVTISPGVTTGELMKFFLNHGICFESDAILTTATYGGLLSGGCHGTGKDETSMSDLITSLKVVDGTGELRTLPGEESDLPDGVTVTIDEIRQAAQVSLGVFGAVVEFTLEVKQMSKCRVQNVFDYQVGEIFPRNGSTQALSELIKGNWSVEIFWFPFNSLLSWMNESLPTPSAMQISTPSYPVPTEGDGNPGLNPLVMLWNPWNDSLWVRQINQTTDDVTQIPGIPLRSRLLDVVGGILGGQILSPLYEAFPGIIPLAAKTSFEVIKLQYGAQADEVVRTPWAVHFRYGIDLMPVYDMEFCFPIDLDNPQELMDAALAVINITKRYAKWGEYPSEKGEGGKIHFPLTLCMEMRILKKGSALLCPSSIGDHDYMAYIEVLSTSGTKGYEQYFADIAKEWVALGGIPHWQKQWTFLQDYDIGDVGIFDYVRTKFGQNLTTFKDVRSQLQLDPDNLFLNSTMQEVLYGPIAKK